MADPLDDVPHAPAAPANPFASGSAAGGGAAGGAPSAGAPEDAAAPSAESSMRAVVADAVKKAMLTGLGAVFLTEESARRLAREWKLPRDVASYVAAQAGGAKDEVLRVVTEEIRKFFESEALRRELVRMVSSMSIEVHAEVRLKPARSGVKPEVKVARVKPRLRRPPDDPSDEHDEHDEHR